MTFLTVMQFIVNIIVVGFMLTVIVIGLIWLIKDKRQSQHSVLRNYPLLARIRYISEKMGPELRQYLFSGDNEGKPFSRNDYKNIVLAGKYKLSYEPASVLLKIIKTAFTYRTQCFRCNVMRFQ